mgnify:CR=1 FL=1
MIFSYFDVTVDFNEGQAFDCSFSEEGAFNVDFGTVAPQNEYDGPYEVTPTDQEQILSTSDKVLAADIVIEPIPSNYGLITWDGSVITVS